MPRPSRPSVCESSLVNYVLCIGFILSLLPPPSPDPHSVASPLSGLFARAPNTAHMLYWEREGIDFVLGSIVVELTSYSMCGI